MSEFKKQVISKWAKGYRKEQFSGPIITGLQQVVYKNYAGKNKKGKTVYSSTTKHERI